MFRNRRIENQRNFFVASRPSCWVRDVNHKKCGKSRYAWTNHMEPLCREHFRARKVIQNLLITLSGRGSWGALVVAHNPEMFTKEL